MRNEVQRYLRRTSRRILVRRLVESADVGVVLGGLAAGCVQLLFWLAGLSHHLPGIAIFAVGPLACVTVTLIKGVSPLQAARYVDSRAELDERLTTAAELIASGDVSPPAQCVYAQATAASESAEAMSVNLWVRGRVLAAGAMLAVLWCGALAMLPQGRSADEQLLAALGDMSPEAIKALAEDFARAAEAPGAEAPLLSRAADAVERKDVRSLEAILADLRRRGVRLARIVRPDVLAMAAGGGSDASDTAATRPADAAQKRPNRHGGGPVHVWDPLYDKLTSNIQSSTQPIGTNGSEPSVSYTDAWSAARLRAAGALRTGSVRAEYRRMVREFFSDRK